MNIVLVADEPIVLIYMFVFSVRECVLCMCVSLSYNLSVNSIQTRINKYHHFVGSFFLHLKWL